MVEYREEIAEFVSQFNRDATQLTIMVNIKDNLINIKPIKTSWNREEVEQLIYKYINDNNQGCIFDSDEEWIGKNLI